MMKSHLLGRIVACSTIIGLFTVVEPIGLLRDGSPAREAEARMFRPATPLSVAGVARRTTRRTIRRTAVYAAALPTGCTQIIVEGAQLYSCSGVYYQPSGGQYVVVQVQ